MPARWVPRNVPAQVPVFTRMSALLLTLLLSIPVDIPGVRSAALFRPAGSGPFPAILMVDGWWTAGSWEKATAERLSAEGYLVLLVLPDRGDRPADRDVMHAAMTGPPGDRNLAGVRAARAWLLARDDVRGRHIGVIGARMGGRDALHLADDPGVVAAVSWYGAPPRKPPRRTPALAFFGGRDMGPTVEEARRFAAAARGTPTEVHIYPEAQHGFADPHNAWGGYDPKAAGEAWTRAAAFLEARLRR